MHSIIGKSVTDKITGFAGVVIGRVEYITGCNQLLVQPRVTDPSKVPESSWIDEQRIDVQQDAGVVTLDNGVTPGFDKAAPKI